MTEPQVTTLAWLTRGKIALTKLQAPNFSSFQCSFLHLFKLILPHAANSCHSVNYYITNILFIFTKGFLKNMHINIKFLTIKNNYFHYSVMSRGERSFSRQYRAWCWPSPEKCARGGAESDLVAEGSASSIRTTVSGLWTLHQGQVPSPPWRHPSQTVVQTVLRSLIKPTMRLAEKLRAFFANLF